MAATEPGPIPEEVRRLLAGVYRFAETGDLGVISTLDNATGEPRFALIGRKSAADGGVLLTPLGYLSTAVYDEVTPPVPTADRTVN